MEYIRITRDNIDAEHVCCAMSGKQALAKKEWLKRRFDEGLIFYRSVERGERVGSYPSGWVSLHRLSMGRRLHERARIFQRPVTGVREGCEGAGAEEHSIPLKTIHIISREQAQNTPAPVTTYALFKDGEFLTQGIQSDKKFLKLAGVQV